MANIEGNMKDQPPRDMDLSNKKNFSSNPGGILGGLADIIAQLTELAEAGNQKQQEVKVEPLVDIHEEEDK